jgi:DNA polymerase III delta prime subunit
MLRQDLSAHPEEWENKTLGDFLDALSAWVEDMDGYYQNNSRAMPESLDWKNIAEMLLAAKYYE